MDIRLFSIFYNYKQPYSEDSRASIFADGLNMLQDKFLDVECWIKGISFKIFTDVVILLSSKRHRANLCFKITRSKL